MKKTIVFLLVVFSAFTLFSQGFVKGVNTKQFPRVSLVVQSYNPDTLYKDQIKIFEADIPVAVDTLFIGRQIEPAKRSSVLILLDLRDPDYTLSMQTYFNLLYGMANVDTNTFFNCSMFRGEPEEGTQYITTQTDFSLLPNVTDEIETNRSESMSVDLGYVLNQAIDQICKRPDEEAKAIILYSAGGLGGSTVGVSDAILKAKERRVQIYVVNINGSVADVDMGKKISSGTYGCFINSCHSYQDLDLVAMNATETVFGWIAELPKRWCGIEYNLTFTSNQTKRTGETKSLKILLDNDTVIKSYEVPSKTLGYWIKTHVVLFIILLVVILAGFGVGLFFLVRWLRNVSEEKKEEENRVSSERKRMKSEQESLRRRLEASESEKIRKQEMEKEQEARKQKQEHLANISLIMRKKNIKARLLVSTMLRPSEEYIVDTPECSIGSSEDNMVAIKDPTVSRHHALLYFNGEEFCLKDLNSTNGIIMNGVRVNELKLRNGDRISLGKANIKIYF